jgi:hypothetical protein
VIESLTWVQLPGVYYALKRNADFSPTGPSGDKTHISYALRVDALPAFVTTPDGSKQVTSIVSYKGEAKPPPERPRSTTFNVIDGIVIDRNAKTQAGPTAVILSPTTAGQ